MDIVSNNTTWTLTSDSKADRFNLPAIAFHDGQSVMVPRRLTVTSAHQLNGVTVGVQPGTTTELNLNDFFRHRNLRFTPIFISDLDELRRTHDSGRCDAFTNDFAALAGQCTLLIRRADHVIMPERIRKELLGPTIRQGDEEQTDIVAWTVSALIEAQELGITMAEAEQMASTSTNRCFLGLKGNMGERISGSRADYARQIIRQFGNYREVYN